LFEGGRERVEQEGDKGTSGGLDRSEVVVDGAVYSDDGDIEGKEKNVLEELGVTVELFVVNTEETERRLRLAEREENCLALSMAEKEGERTGIGSTGSVGGNRAK
jgi:hypothetical protein